MAAVTFPAHGSAVTEGQRGEPALSGQLASAASCTRAGRSGRAKNTTTLLASEARVEKRAERDNGEKIWTSQNTSASRGLSNRAGAASPLSPSQSVRAGEVCARLLGEAELDRLWEGGGRVCERRGSSLLLLSTIPFLT